MLLPSIFGENLFDDWMDMPHFSGFGDIDKKLYGKNAAHLMKTDVRELDGGYEIDIDLPGFKKDEIDISLDNGYLIVGAAKGLDKDENDKKGRVIRCERYAGSMQRSFYVGRDITNEDIKAKFEDGVLKLTVPKKDTRAVPEKKTIMIE